MHEETLEAKTSGAESKPGNLMNECPQMERVCRRGLTEQMPWGCDDIAFKSAFPSFRVCYQNRADAWPLQRVFSRSSSSLIAGRDVKLSWLYKGLTAVTKTWNHCGSNSMTVCLSLAGKSPSRCVGSFCRVTRGAEFSHLGLPPQGCHPHL